MTHERFVAFLRAVSDSAAGEHFAAADVVAAFEARDIGSRIAPPAEMTFSAPAETFDRILRGDLGIMLAIASRKIVAEGKVPHAMRLVPAFERSLPHYR